MSVKETIEKRRAYRSLEPVDITRDLVNDLAEMAKISPSCGNKQPWRFVFVYDKQALKQLFTALSGSNKWVEKASMIIGVFSKPENDCTIGERLYYLFDTGMAKEILGIPNAMRLITLVIVGKHTETVNPVLSDSMKLGEKQRPPRKAIEDFIYINKYKE